mmetsp:Transcript_29347/g.64982  ORF Transcript_29347/g.64982 Transcript_29347/m.64982 type:complete len:215 (-) Transcript_29347:956-1600(-)
MDDALDTGVSVSVEGIRRSALPRLDASAAEEEGDGTPPSDSCIWAPADWRWRCCLVANLAAHSCSRCRAVRPTSGLWLLFCSAATTASTVSLKYSCPPAGSKGPCCCSGGAPGMVWSSSAAAASETWAYNAATTSLSAARACCTTAALVSPLARLSTSSSVRQPLPSTRCTCLAEAAPDGPRLAPTTALTVRLRTSASSHCLSTATKGLSATSW